MPSQGLAQLPPPGSPTSLGPRSPKGAGDVRSFQTNDPEGFLVKSLAGARKTGCPNAPGYYLVSATTGQCFEMSCRSWGCSHCVKLRKMSAAEVVAGGVYRQQNLGERLRFITLTAPSDGLTMPELGAAWNRLRATLKKNELLGEYVAVAELQERGEPHLHVIATGEYMEQAELSKWGVKAGFGPVTDIRAVRGSGRRSLTGYLLKQLDQELADYVTKASAAKLKERAAMDASKTRKQVRPVRLSRKWYPGGFKAAEQAVLARQAIQRGEEEGKKDAGPWFVVVKASDGNVAVLSRPKLVEQDEPTEPRGARPQAVATSGDGGDGEAQLARAA